MGCLVTCNGRPKVFEWWRAGHDQTYLIEDSGGQPQHLQVLQILHFNCNTGNTICNVLSAAGAGWRGYCFLINTNTRGDSSLEITATGFNDTVKT